MRSEPARHGARRERLAVDVEAGLCLRLDRVERLEQPVAQHPELEGVEHLVNGVTVPGLQGEVGGRDVQVEVTHQLVQAAVRDHLAQVGAQ